MMNNGWFRVKINVCRPHKGEIGIVFEHPTQPGNQSGGWMAKERHSERSQEINPILKKSVSSPFINTTSITYSISEVKKHKSPDSVWIIVHDHVYDCTRFLKDDPGGLDNILINAGTDCTDEFEAIHSDKAKKLLDDYRIDELVTTGYISDSSSPNNLMHGNSEFTHLALIKEIMALNPREKIPCKLISKTSLSHDVRLFRFALPSEDQLLGLPVRKHVFLCVSVDEKLIMQAYTPTSSIDEIGYFELVVKIYFKNVHPNFSNGRLMSQYLDSLTIGSIVEVKGPVGHIEYLGRGNIMVHGKQRFTKNLVNFAGGTGITSVYQVANAILKDANDRTEMHVVYANMTEDDILLREKLDEWIKVYSDRFKIWYVVENAKEGWEYSVRFITRSIIREHVPLTGEDILALVCGPPSMIQFAVQSNLEKMGGMILRRICLCFRGEKKKKKKVVVKLCMV